ncbi:hypothetical protein QJS10_CPA06g00121 [Acorus calamus]|uniref:Uncharacterized protein n=1 Tax=Acorus calamus TaxID=4465 RepID=A0AAV9EHL5_ACOCL|nr:hypothetical protein QJS10_CPA06g00121 [Acorus calamus]
MGPTISTYLEDKNHSMSHPDKGISTLFVVLILFPTIVILKAFNSDADEQANLALELCAGEVKEVYDH